MYRVVSTDDWEDDVVVLKGDGSKWTWEEYVSSVVGVKECKGDNGDKTGDLVERPSHYLVAGTEVNNIIEELTKDLIGMEAICLGNIIKYVLRCTKKGNMTQDLSKAKKYIKIMEELSAEV